MYKGIIQKRKTKSIGHILLRKCHIRLFIEGKIERNAGETGIRGRRSKQLLDELK
jgi:hypothetical protein